MVVALHLLVGCPGGLSNNKVITDTFGRRHWSCRTVAVLLLLLTSLDKQCAESIELHFNLFICTVAARWWRSGGGSGGGGSQKRQ